MNYKIIAIGSQVLFIYGLPKLFYLFWPDNIENEQYFYTFMISFTHLTICILCNLYYYYFYRSNSKQFEQYKVEKKPWPWNGNQQEWVDLRRKCFKNLIQNSLLGILLAYISSGFKMEFRVDKNFPTYFEMISQSIFFALLYDFMFYWSHRVLHHSSIYRFIHKKHHEFNVTISIAAEYAHPIEYIFGNLIPFSAGSAILGNKCHLVTILMWLCVAIHKTSADHCGYRFPWDFYQYLPFWVDSDYHSYHHCVNIGNYSGAFKIWDSLLGTSKEFYNDLRNRNKNN